MDNKKAGINIKHSFAVAMAVVIGGILIWIIQLARNGDPIGYIILAGGGVLLALPVVGLVLYMLIIAISKLQQQPNLTDMKTIRESQRVLSDQNREMARLMRQMQGASNQSSDPQPVPPMLGPGQIMTPEGFVVEGTAFDTLDDEDDGI
ncbi:MAG: hypothetical protein AAF485_03210 [Chloroflexota bacterium]